MRRLLLALVLLVVAAGAGAAVFAVYASEREYVNQVAAGDRAVAADQPFLALEAYSGAITLKPDSMVAHLKRGMTYRERGELDAAARDLRRAAELDPSAIRPLELLADVHMELRRYDRAAERYEAYLRLDESARVLYKLGLARYRTGQLPAATTALQRAVQVDKSLAEAHYLLGLCMREQGQLAAARASLETAALLAPALTGVREALAAVYSAADEPARAIEQLEALAALDPTRPDRLVAVGLAHAKTGHYEAAVLALGRAIERFPDSPHATAALGHVWLRQAELRNDSIALKKALEALSTAASHSDAASETLTDLGRAWLLSGQPAAAERAFRRAVSALPVAPDAFVQLATLLARDGRVQEARDALVRYATLVGDGQPHAGIATQIADYSMKLGEPQLAVRWLDRAIAEAGPSALLLGRLADAASRAGDVERARAAVHQGLKLDPADRILLAVRARLGPRE